MNDQSESVENEVRAGAQALTAMIGERIYFIRRHHVMSDRDLARLYGVTTFNLNKAVKRNLSRFPPDFMFQLNQEEHRALRFQLGILKRGQHSKYPPRVFTEQGVAMLSSVLHSERAVQVNIAIMRTFVRLRQLLATNTELAHKLAELEQCVATHDERIRTLFKTIRTLMTVPAKPHSRIGFRASSE